MVQSVITSAMSSGSRIALTARTVNQLPRAAKTQSAHMRKNRGQLEKTSAAVLRLIEAQMPERHAQATCVSAV